MHHQPTIRRPASFAVPQNRRLDRTRDALNVAERLLQIIEVGCAGIADVLRLPVAECINEPGRMSETTRALPSCSLVLQNANLGNQFVGSAILELVPAVGGSDGLVEAFLASFVLEILNVCNEFIDTQTL